MFVIGLTGGIGTGKSEVSRILKELGAVVLDADSFGHRVYLPNTEGLREVVETFGEDVLSPDGEIDRRALGGKVFGNPDAMAKLNAIAWPKIRDMVQESIDEQEQSETPVVVLDAAVLIEAGWIDVADEVWVVSAPEEQVVSRIQVRNNLSEEQVRARINSQMTTQERIKYADKVIDNSEDFEQLHVKVNSLWQQLIMDQDLSRRFNG